MKNANNSMICQTVHLSIYVFSATQILSRRPTFTNGLISTNRPVYIKGNYLAAVSVDSIRTVDSTKCTRLNVCEYNSLICFTFC